MVATEEKALLTALRDPGQRAWAFDRMVKSHQRMLYQHIRRMVLDHADADDVLQNTFLKAWKNLDRFRGDAALRTWLYRIATNEALTWLNQRKRRAYSAVEDLQDDHRHSQAAGTDPEGTDIQRHLQAAIASLPQKQRAVFNLRYFEELKYEEMAEILDTSVGGLKANYHHAVKKIENYLSERVTHL
jgi:RNA polymerase sigma factor (sigma-70 family)